MFIEDGNNVIDVYEGFKKAVDHVRSGKGPVLIESVTTVGLDTHHQTLVNIVHVKKLICGRKKTQSKTFAQFSLRIKLLVQKNLMKFATVKEAVEASVKFVEESLFPPLESAFEDIYASRRSSRKYGN